MILRRRNPGLVVLFAALVLTNCSASSASIDASEADATSSASGAPKERDAATAPGAETAAAVNAVLLGDGTLLSLERASRTGVARAFRRNGDNVEIYDESGQSVGSVNIKPPSKSDGDALFGGFDLDADGVVDFGITRSAPTNVRCGESIVNRTRVDLYSTGTGKLLFSTPDEDDKCWTFPNTTYPTTQWTVLAAMFGPTPGKLALATQYPMTGSIVSLAHDREGAEATKKTFIYPSNPAFSSYAAARVRAHGGTKHYENSHVPNGLFLHVGDAERLVFFTSARVVQYAGGRASSTPAFPPFESVADESDLIADTPFLPGGRTDLVGRNYGVVSVDPAAPQRVVLLNGTPSRTLARDQLAHTMTSDPWGGIERHIALYDASSNALTDRFFSYAHDENDGHQFQGRVSYPDHPWLPSGAHRPSRVVYGVYDKGHWSTHISSPNSLDDAVVVRGLVPWDVRDVDGDGVEELIASPTELPGDPDVPGYYYTKWETHALRWNEATAKLERIHTYVGIPELVPAFRTATTTTSSVARFPVAVVRVDGRARLVLRNQRGERVLGD